MRLARRVSWLAAGSLTAVALLAPAGVSAHTPKVSLTCEAGLKVNLTNYNTNGTNSVAVSIDGTPVGGSPFTFSSSYSHTFAVEPATEAHSAIVVVTAWDDPTGSRGWTKTFQLGIDACVEPTPTPEPEPTPTPEPEPEATPTPEPEPEATPTPETEVAPTAAPPEPTGEVGGSTGTPAATSKATLPPTDAIDGEPTSPAGDGWRIVLLAVAGVLAATLMLTPARAVVRKDDRTR
jgi:hypothetical protein